MVGLNNIVLANRVVISLSAIGWFEKFCLRPIRKRYPCQLLVGWKNIVLAHRETLSLSAIGWLENIVLANREELFLWAIGWLENIVLANSCPALQWAKKFSLQTTKIAVSKTVIKNIFKTADFN